MGKGLLLRKKPLPFLVKVFCFLGSKIRYQELTKIMNS